MEKEMQTEANDIQDVTRNADPTNGLENVVPEVNERDQKYPDDVLWVKRRMALEHARKEDPENYLNKLLPRLEPVLDWREVIEIDYERDKLLTQQGLDALFDRYLSKKGGETSPNNDQ